MTPQPPPVDVLPTHKRRWRSPWSWIVVTTVIFISAAMTLAYLFFTAPIPDNTPDTTGINAEAAAQLDAAAELEIARLRAEARRNTLALGAGLAALAALALSARRQHHHEHSTREAQAAELRRQLSLEDKAAKDIEDATQRRIIDARIRAIEQLGSKNSVVRIGGLHTLERIGQLHHELQQVIFDEICAYLRRPPTPSGTAKLTPLSARQFEPIGPAPLKDASDEDESQVRKTAQEILQRHLNPGDPEQYWEHFHLNLRNAHLNEVQLLGCHLVGSDFTNATFTGYADFEGTTFTSYAGFNKATFTGDADFTSAIFTGYADFEGTTFTGDADFISSTFTGDADFEDANFAKGACFSMVHFTHEMEFSESDTNFTSSTFTGDADFSAAFFSDGGNFEGAVFTGDADFGDAHFEGPIGFGRGRIQGGLRARSLALLEALESQDTHLATGAAHRLPERWGLEPDPANLEWGRLKGPARANEGGGTKNTSDVMRLPAKN